MTMMNRHDGDEEPTEAPRVAAAAIINRNISRHEENVKFAAFAYHMFHSGQIYNTIAHPDSRERATIIDRLAETTITRMEEMQIPLLESSIRSIGSYYSQIRSSDNENIPMLSIDVASIESGLVLPLTQPENTTLSLPRGIDEIGIVFNTWEHLRNSYNNLASLICTSPKSVLFWLQKYETMFLDIADPEIAQRREFHRVKPEWRITNTPVFCERRFEDILHALDVGRLVRITGQVTEVGDPKVVLTHIAFRCMEKNQFGLECGHIELAEQKEEESGIQKPGDCPHCATGNWVKLDSRESTSEAMQRVVLQEEDISGDARSIMVELRGSLCNVHLAGDTIEVIGVVRVEPISKNSTICTPYLLASNYTQSNSIDTELNLLPSDFEAIESFNEEGDMEYRMGKMMESLAGHIHSAEDSSIDDIKRAIILQGCGCPEETLFEHRGGIRIFIVGDPGTAKTKLLKLATRIHPGSRFTTAEAASQAGMMGGCQQVEDLYTGRKRWAVVPGAIPLTHPDGVCAIDEFNLYKGEFGDFNTAMENGEIVIDKIAKARIRAQCSIIAGANPKSKDANRKKFNKTNQIPYAMQIGLDFTTLQRFDAIFVLEDIADEGNDSNIALSMLGNWQEQDDSEDSDDANEGDLSMDFIQKYLSVCRNRDVSLSEEASNYIAKTHATKRKEAVDEESLRSHRQVASMARFALAAARFDGVPTATLKHVRFVEKILENTLQEKDPGVVDGGMTEDARTLRSRVAKEFSVLIDDGFMVDDHTIEEIYSEMSKSWNDIPPMDVVEKTMMSFAQNKATTSIYRRADGTYSYEGVNNPAYEWW